MHYVQNRTGGDALRRPEPHLRHDGDMRFTTAYGMFECLEAVLDDRNRKRNMEASTCAEMTSGSILDVPRLHRSSDPTTTSISSPLTSSRWPWFSTPR